jgi:amidohydrolase
MLWNLLTTQPDHSWAFEASVNIETSHEAQPNNEDPASGWLARWVQHRHADLVDVRRHLHAHPELGFNEHGTTKFLVDQLISAGLKPRVLPRGTGLVVDIGSGPRTIALRADIDALPLPDLKDVSYRSTTDGVCHACGHDAHTTVALGAALALAQAPQLPGRIRVIFQPAEELMGGAREVIAAGELDDVEAAFALHCDGHLDVGKVGIKTGSITAACDLVDVRISGPGGHTARPHLTVDLVDALSRIAATSPALISRRVDPRAGLSLVWGAIQAGTAPNAIPGSGTLRGTVRVLDRTVWAEAEKHVSSVVNDVAAGTGAAVNLHYERGVPPVVNDPGMVDVVEQAIVTELGDDALTTTRTSMGGEDFSWFGEQVPTAMARLGVHGPGTSMRDLHQGTFDIDEIALAVGVKVMTRTALQFLAAA